MAPMKKLQLYPNSTSYRKESRCGGEKAKQAVHKEIKQLHDRVCFKPVDPKNLTESELQKAQQALTFVTEKRDGTIKARTVYDGSKTRDYLSKQDTKSPTVSLEGLMLSMCIDAAEGRDVMTCDIPNAFIQADILAPTY